MNTLLTIIIGIFAGIGIMYSCCKVAKAIVWLETYKETIEAYARLQKELKK